MSLESFEDLEDKFRCSRIQHNFGEVFDMFFEKFREMKLNILIIGVQSPETVGNFERYFPNAMIHGLDIEEDNKKFEKGRIKIHIGSQTDHKFLLKLPKMNIVVDDGTQIEEPTVQTFKFLFTKRMENPGLYIIQKNWFKTKGKGKKLMLDLIEQMEFFPEKYKGPWSQYNKHGNVGTEFSKNIIGVHFFRELTVIERGKNPEDRWSKKRIQYPEICKFNEIKVYGKELGDWSHLDDSSKTSIFGSNERYLV